MKKSQKYRNVIDALAYQEGRSRSLGSLLSEKRFWVKTAIYVAPIAIVSYVFVALVNTDEYFFDNPNELEEIELNQVAYRDSLLDMSNPWNRINIDDPASFLLALFVGADADVISKLKEMIAILGNDKLLYLTDLLRVVELSDAQRDRFVILISTLLKSDAGLEKIPFLVDLLKNLEEAEKELLKQKPEELVGEQQLLAANQDLVQLQELAPEELVNYNLVELLTTDKPEALSFLLGSMTKLSPSEYEKLMSLISALGVSRTEKLLSLLDDLSFSNVRRLITILATLDANTLRKVVDRLDTLPLSVVDDVIGLSSKLSVNETKQLFTVTASFSLNNFKSFVSLHSQMSVPTIKKSFEIYKDLNVSDVKSLSLNILENYTGQASNLSLMLTILSDFSTGTVKSFIDNFENLSSEGFKDLPFVFRKLNSGKDKERLVEEASFISLNNREKALEVFRSIHSRSVSQVLDISTNLSSVTNKTQLIEQSYRIYDFNENERDSSGRTIDGYSAPSTVFSTDTTEVLEDLVDQMHDINDRDLNKNILEVSDDLSDLSLYRGAEVISGIDINASDLSKPFAGLTKPGERRVTLSKARRTNTRVHRLIQIQRQLTRKERATAIDTLHDIDSRAHRKAAIDLGYHADTELLKDSISYSEQLRFRLGDDEGLEANKRMIVVASRVNDDSLDEFNAIRDSEERYYSTINEARQAGLNALQNEREVLVSKILKQTTKDSDPFGYLRTFESGGNIIRIVSLYENLDRLDPKANRFDSTRAAELANALGSSEGVILGPNGPAGVSREVSQETKLRRIDEYLAMEDYDVLWERRVIALTDRPIIVTHIEEHQFGIPDPERVRKDTREKPKVILLKPKPKPTQSSGF